MRRTVQHWATAVARYPLYKADAEERRVKHISRSCFYSIMSAAEFVDKTAETCCCGT